MKEQYKVGLRIVVVAVGYVDVLATFARTSLGVGPYGRAVVRAESMLAVPVVEAQENAAGTVIQVPVPAPGSVWEFNGKKYQVRPGPQRITPGPAGYKICPNGVPVTHDVTQAEVQEATKCRDGNPLSPNCTAGSISYLCNPETSQKVEMVTPSNAERMAAAARGVQIPDVIQIGPHN